MQDGYKNITGCYTQMDGRGGGMLK
jgi:hypothetical protein